MTTFVIIRTFMDFLERKRSKELTGVSLPTNPHARILRIAKVRISLRHINVKRANHCLCTN
jgi:hypothetical protein